MRECDRQCTAIYMVKDQGFCEDEYSYELQTGSLSALSNRIRGGASGLGKLIHCLGVGFGLA